MSKPLRGPRNFAETHCRLGIASDFSLNVDVADIFNLVVKAGGEAVWVNARDMFGTCFYDTRVGRKSKEMGNRDFLAEVILEARKRGIFVVPTVEVNNAGADHPEWLMLDNEGKPAQYPFQESCFNQKGFLEYNMAICEELVAYDTDGIYLGMVQYPAQRLACYCGECQRLFKEKTGRELPVNPTWDDTWRAFLEFRYDTVERYANALRARIKTIKPDLLVYFTYHGAPQMGTNFYAHRPVQHSRMNDILQIENYLAWGTIVPSFRPRFIRHVSEGISRETFMHSQLNCGTPMPVEMLKWNFFTSLCNGCRPLVYIRTGGSGPDLYSEQTMSSARPDAEVHAERLGDAYAEVKEKLEYLEGEPVKYVGLYDSVKTRDWYERMGENKTGPQPRWLSESVMGAYRALVESQIPTDVLHDENVSLEMLRAYPVLYLPNIAILDDGEREMLTRYVREGGNLICTYDTGLFDGNGVQKKDFDLGEIFSVEYVGKTNRFQNAFIRLTSQGGVTDGMDYGALVIAQGPANIVRRKGDSCKVLGELLSSEFKAVGPGAVMNSYGKGKAIYLSARIAESYVARDGFQPEQRILIKNIVHAIGPEPAVRIRAPLNVESILMEQKEENRLIIHLIGHNRVQASYGYIARPHDESDDLIMEEPPMYKARLTINVKYRKVRALGGDTAITAKANTVELLVNRTHEAIVVER